MHINFIKGFESQLRQNALKNIPVNRLECTDNLLCDLVYEPLALRIPFFIAIILLSVYKMHINFIMFS